MYLRTVRSPHASPYSEVIWRHSIPTRQILRLHPSVAVQTWVTSLSSRKLHLRRVRTYLQFMSMIAVCVSVFQFLISKLLSFFFSSFWRKKLILLLQYYCVSFSLVFFLFNVLFCLFFNTSFFLLDVFEISWTLGTSSKIVN